MMVLAWFPFKNNESSQREAFATWRTPWCLVYLDLIGVDAPDESSQVIIGPNKMKHILSGIPR
jgi:hypothetical protein